MEFLIEIADYLILVKFYKEMLGGLRCKRRSVWIFYSAVLLCFKVWMAQFPLLWLQLMATLLCLVGTAEWFPGKRRNKALVVLFFWGILLSADLLVVCLASMTHSSALSVGRVFYKLIYLVLVYFLCSVFCSAKQEALRELPTGTTAAMATILIACGSGCVFLNRGGVKEHFDYLSIYVLLLVFMVIHFLIFWLLERMEKMMQVNYEQELMLQEIRWKESHFQELEEINQGIMRIGHDMKNRLHAIGKLDDVEQMRESLSLICGEIELKRSKIYTRNQIIDGICKNKFDLAERSSILVETKISVPTKMGMEAGELGILLGNILDNAIEANREAENKYIYFAMKVQGCNLLISMENGKNPNVSESQKKQTKRGRKEHGYGMVSVRKIVEKYEGILTTEDGGTWYRTEMVLYRVV